MKLILVRHGQSVYNLENRFTGQINVELTDKGKEEARQAGIKLKNEIIDLAFTSKLIRAQDTLKIILNEIKKNDLKVEEDKALNERSYGDLEGLNKKSVAEKYGAEQVHIWRRSYDVPPSKGESLKDTYERVIPYYESKILPALKQNKNILVVAHGNSLRSLIMNIEKLSPKEIIEVEIATGQPIIYTFDENLNLINKDLI